MIDPFIEAWHTHCTHAKEVDTVKNQTAMNLANTILDVKSGTIEWCGGVFRHDPVEMHANDLRNRRTLHGWLSRMMSDLLMIL
jgi:hypothetical protein